MIESPYVYRLVTARQSPSDQAYFATRASQCFSAATSVSWLDVYLSPTPTEATTQKSVLNTTTTGSGDLFSAESDSTSLNTIRIENEFELRRLLTGTHNAALKIFLIRQRNSLSRLSISWRLYDTLCQQVGVFEKFRDYVSCFGISNGESEVTPPPMHFHLSHNRDVAMSLKFECAYMLRFVESNNRQHGNPWSLRRSAVYNKFTYNESCGTWVFISLSLSAEAQIQTWQTSRAQYPTSSPFDVHYILFDTAISGWRRYILYLASEVQKQSDRAILADLETDGEALAGLEGRQYLKQIEDNVTDLISSLSFMMDNVDMMTQLYQDFRLQVRAVNDINRDDLVTTSIVLKGFHDRKRDLSRFLSQAEALRRKVYSASSLVSNILELNNSNTLKVLAIESRAENANMSLLTKKSVQDAAMVKVLTIVTLVYLPITVVTNFFSTQFVNSYTNTSGETRLNVVPQVWILFAASVPLTIFTIYIWWIFAQKEVRGKYPGGLDLLFRKTKAVLIAKRRPADTSTIES